MQKILFLDTETTGLDNHPTYGHPQVIELGTIEILDGAIFIEYLRQTSIEELIEAFLDNTTNKKLSNWRPSMNIHSEATKVHGWTNKKLIDGGFPKSELIPKLSQDISFVIGHNIAYDLRCLNEVEFPSICTMKLVRKIRTHVIEFPKIVGENGHITTKLDDLIKFFYVEELKKEETLFNWMQGFHNALIDTYKCILLLKALLQYVPNVKDFNQLAKLQ